MNDPITLSGYLYDGQTSGRRAIAVVVTDEGLLTFAGPSNEVGADTSAIQFSDLTVSSRVGNSSRYLTLPDNNRFETLDNDAVDQLCQRWHGKQHGLADRLERNMKLVFVAVLVVGIGSFAFVRYGIPALSKPVASLIPTELDERLGEQTLSTMDDTWLKPSKLSEERQAELQAVFSELLPADEESKSRYQLLFREIENIPNAFALPNGTVIMTDELVKLADRDEMLASILLHEIGHVEERHSIQMLVRQAGLSAVILLVTGDVNSASSLLLLLPGMLAQAHYSQNLEIEADTYALDNMLDRGMNTEAFADIMLKLESYGANEQDNGSKTKTESESGVDDSSTNIFDYLSSHPATAERIERFRTGR